MTKSGMVHQAPLNEITRLHPYYISVTEINHNATDRTLEISCKIFTDDFEKVLADKYKTKVDLIKPINKPATEKLIADYVKNHLSINVDDKTIAFTYLGYELEQEAIYSYYQADHINAPKKLQAGVSLLHDFSENQINILHVTINGNRKSIKLDFPKTEASFSF